jgi:hypothetical protein
MLNLISIHPQLNGQYPILRVHTYLGCINTKYFYTVLCMKMNHMLTLRGILAIIYIYKNVTASLSASGPKSQSSESRAPMALQFGYNVAGE